MPTNVPQTMAPARTQSCTTRREFWVPPAIRAVGNASQDSTKATRHDEYLCAVPRRRALLKNELKKQKMREVEVES